MNIEPHDSESEEEDEHNEYEERKLNIGLSSPNDSFGVMFGHNIRVDELDGSGLNIQFS